MAAGGKFGFQLLSRTFGFMEDREIKDLFMKWGLQGFLSVQTYMFEKQFQAYQKDDFVLDFLRDPKVTSTLLMPSKRGGLSAVGSAAASVTAKAVPCSILSMDFFDRLRADGLVHEDGRICGCFDEYVEGFTISDEIRKMLLMEESDHYDLYSDVEKEEFLYLLFRHVVLGGGCCQYEDSVDPYLTTVKTIYKQLLSVQKDPTTKKLQVISNVFRVTALDEKGNTYYPSEDPDHPQNFCYLLVDPLKRHVTVFSHVYGGSPF
ncbi:C11orf70 [Branchiostoma lanceolatum]|uniref:Cilia- and flagella-associated protein 300 n=1 Tax=Branchiostoma lanceolatum TaxID=7740 RepID=A0A8J9Z1I2_BRALA|nr:C11orf70 [Branchiostoma lanceolatum]